ncbi:hypothetical protein ACXN5S_09995 [Pseudoroseicyclus sp. H15]
MRSALTLLLGSTAALGGAQAAVALDADYWRGGWRTELGTDPHIYEFVIEGKTVRGYYCTSCSDVTTAGFIDGTWSEEEGLSYTVRFPNPDGSIHTTLTQHAMLDGSQITVTGDGVEGDLALIKDPRGPDIGANPVEMYPPGTPATPAMEEVPPQGKTAGTTVQAASDGYWQPAEFTQELGIDDVAGTWIALFWGGVGMNKQLFNFVRFEDGIRGYVCGRCDNPWTHGSLEDIVIDGELVYYKIAHEDWGPPGSWHQDVGRIVQNEMVVAAFIDQDVNAENIPAEAPPIEGYVYSMLGPISMEATAGNSSENVDIWGPGTGSSVQPPEGREPVAFAFPE